MCGAVCFALTSDQLGDGLWCRKNLCSNWRHLITCVLIVPKFDLIGSKGCCCMTVAWYHTRLCNRTHLMCSSSAPSVGGNLLLSASCLQNKCHLRSGILVMWTPFGQYLQQTNLANSSFTSCVRSPSIGSFMNALGRSRSAFMYT